MPGAIRARLIEKIRTMGRRLSEFSHERLQGRPEFRLRIGDYRIIYKFDVDRNEILLVTLGHRSDVYR